MKAARNDTPARRFARLLPIWIGVAVSLWLLALVAAGFAATSASTCTSGCHSMRPYAAHGGAEEHAGLTCQDCHRLGFVSGGVALHRRFFAQAVGRVPASAPTDDAPCRSCHKRLATRTVVASAVRVRHAELWSRPCVDCHGGIGHKIEGRVYGVSQMQECVECHSVSARDPKSCDFCHHPNADDTAEEATLWRATHGPNWDDTHGMGDLESCISCHQPAQCADCHGVPLPHNEAWPQVHGLGLTAEYRTLCEDCHEPTWCSGCHGIDMPHAGTFLKEHDDQAATLGMDVCMKCHIKGACDDCHLRSSHPDLPMHFHSVGETQ